MIPNLVIAAIIGWCGTGWPFRFPRGGGGGGGGDTDPWPPNCRVCGPFVGALSAVILVYVLGPAVESSGLVGLATFSFFAGSFGSSLIGNLRNLASKG